MIEEASIRFRREDVPEIPEVRPAERPQRRDIPEPEEWRPFGFEW